MGNKLKYTLDTIHVVSDHIKDLINNYTIFLFEGDMGSGKTTLIKQVVKDIGISENVKSPTFSLVNEYIENDIYRRQDLPPAWMHYHYVCCFKVNELKNLNNELLNSKTYPIFLSKEYAKNLIEIDTPDDLKRWKEANI